MKISIKTIDLMEHLILTKRPVNVSISSNIEKLALNTTEINRIKAIKHSRFTLPQIEKSNNYTKFGVNIDVGQGCIYVGEADEIVKSYGFDSCAPFAMINGQGKRKVLGHIDVNTKPKEIYWHIKNNFSDKEIQGASYHYWRGAETLHPKDKLGSFAIETIQKALKLLGVEGKYEGALETGFEDIIIKRSNKIDIKR